MAPIVHGTNTNAHQMVKSVRSVGHVGHYANFDHPIVDHRSQSLSNSFQQQTSGGIAQRRQPRRLPSVPPFQRQRSAQPRAGAKTSTSLDVCELLHIVTHEYIGGVECSLRPGERLVLVDNGDPDWKHGFKVNDYLERLVTFPSTCVAAYRPEERPMRLVRNCNLLEQKMRLYRDQIVFVQPNSLESDGRVLVRNEHNKFMQCPIQFLTTLS
uniref:SH3 domain-containing protein n=1 Tax=Globodera rostochiensis TaxID=31243 RepID=A0A914HTK4_GLORO